MRTLVTIVVLASLVGCGDPKLNANFAKITNGMAKDEVVKIMGSPGTEIAAGLVPEDQLRVPVVTGSKILEWKKDSPTHRVLIGFDDDKVVSKWQWIPNL